MTGPASPPKSRRMPHPAWILCQPLAGMQAQALGFAGALDLDPELKLLEPPAPWRYVTARLWPAPLRVVGLDAAAAPDLVLGCGGTAAPVGAALRRPGRRWCMCSTRAWTPRRFDLVVADRHDGLTGPNVIVTRTALHRVTPARLAEAPGRMGAACWRICRARWWRCWSAAATAGSAGCAGWPPIWRQQLAGMMRRDRVGLALTPSRRTDAGGDRGAGASAAARWAAGSGTGRATTRISACWRWPTRSLSRPTASPWSPRPWPPAAPVHAGPAARPFAAAWAGLPGC